MPPKLFFKKIFFTLVLSIAVLVSTNFPVPVAAGSENWISASSGAVISLYPNIETMGVVVSGVSLPQTAQLMYRLSSESNWRTGHPLVRIDDGRLVGSLFELSPSTSYTVKVVVGSEEVTSSSSTQSTELQFTPTTVIHVKANAPAGGDGSAASPYRTIQEGVNHANPGTQVLVADGLYQEAVTFPASGDFNKWIQVKAEGGGAILNGSDNLTGKIWTPHPTKAHVWFTKINSAIEYLARDKHRFYKYDDLSGLNQSRGHGDVTIAEGWFFEQSTLKLYVRSSDDPSGHSWQVPRLNHAFDVNGRDWIWIEGFEMQFYGTTTNGCGVCTLNASHIVIRKNKIHNLQLGIFINWTGVETGGNDTRIESNEIFDPPVDEWPWLAVKGSTMENTGIVLRGHIGAIVRDNKVHNYFNGIYTGSSGALENPGVAFDADIYNNYIHHISDDGFEPEGTCINQRFRNNIVDRTLIGISLAPITQGPTWVLRSVFTNYTSSPIKWASKPDGTVYFYHNTSWTNAANLNAMSMITPIKNTVMRNNIFQGNRYAFEEPFTGSTGNDWNNDNWYTTRAAGNPHFKWENTNYNTIKNLCSATGLECNGYEDPPGLTKPASGDFTLLSSSPNIDRGVLIPGINDNFKGAAPDVGAYEFASDPFPKVLSIARIDPNPTATAIVRFKVDFSISVSGVDAGDFSLVNMGGVTGVMIDAVSGSGTTYTITVNTGAGDGNLRLDLLDDDSIVDASGHPLGGTGNGNGNFSNGEEYIIRKIPAKTYTESFKSVGAQDGWVLESGEDTLAGSKVDKSSSTLLVGDDPKDRQYRTFLSFNTISLPDTAIIVSVEVKIKKQGIVGTDPFVTHGVLLLEVRDGAFGKSLSLEAIDFSSPAGLGSSIEQMISLGSVSTTLLSSNNLKFINKYGVTQFRVRFSKDDNDDRGADYVKFFSGNSTDSNRPQLTVTYYVP